MQEPPDPNSRKADVYKNYCWNDLTPISSEIILDAHIADGISVVPVVPVPVLVTRLLSFPTYLMTFHNSTFGTFKQAQKVDKQTEAEQTEPGHQLVRFYHSRL